MSRCGAVCSGEGDNYSCVYVTSCFDYSSVSESGCHDGFGSGESKEETHTLTPDPKKLEEFGFTSHSDRDAAKSTPYYFKIFSDDSSQCVSAKELYNVVTQNMFDSHQKIMGSGDLFLGTILGKIQMNRSITKIRKTCKPLEVDVRSDQSKTTPLTKMYQKHVLKTTIGFVLHSSYVFDDLCFIPPEIRGDGHFIYLKSADGKYTLNGQNDGNLVIYGPTGAIWATGHQVYGNLYGKSLFLSQDGKLHWAWGDKYSRWSSHVSGLNNGAPYTLQLGNDGKMTVCDKKKCVFWSSH